jgi:predicted GNAT family acetyltransferase
MTIPSHQGKGVATLLVRTELVEADKAGLKSIVM